MVVLAECDGPYLLSHRFEIDNFLIRLSTFSAITAAVITFYGLRSDVTLLLWQLEQNIHTARHNVTMLRHVPYCHNPCYSVDNCQVRDEYEWISKG